jgi:hypothetical protein
MPCPSAPVQQSRHHPRSRNEDTLKKRWTLHAWIICVCEFRKRGASRMGRNRQGGEQSGGKPAGPSCFSSTRSPRSPPGIAPAFSAGANGPGTLSTRFGEAFGIAEPRAPHVDKRLHKERLARRVDA